MSSQITDTKWQQAEAELIQEIRSLHEPVRQLAQEFRAVVSQREYSESVQPARYTARYWQLAVLADSFTRLKLLIEQHSTFLETLTVLACVRYLFELSLWVRLVQRDSGYGLAYYCDLIEKQKRHYDDLQKHCIEEIEFLRQTSEKEDSLMAQKLAKLKENPASAATLMQEVEDQIDRAAARRFTLHGEDARSNGYSFQAHLVETQVLPRIRRDLEEVVKEQCCVEAALPLRIKKLAKDSSAWKSRAKIVSVVHEYDFIYSYTSRLLHATPASITTDQKNLETGERAMFLRYAKVRILDLIDIGTTMLADVRSASAPGPPVQ